MPWNSRSGNSQVLPANMLLFFFLRFKIFSKLMALWFVFRFLVTPLYLPTWKWQVLGAVTVFLLSFWSRHNQDTQPWWSVQERVLDGEVWEGTRDPLETNPSLGFSLTVFTWPQLMRVTPSIFSSNLIKFCSSHCWTNTSVSTACFCKGNGAPV